MKPGTPKAAAPTPQRFNVMPCLDGFEVVDAHGRPVAAPNSELSAGMYAATLNEAAARGPKSLARALSAGEDAYQ